MTENRLPISRGLALTGALVLVLLAGGFPTAQSTWAAPARRNVLDATQDTYIDIDLATTNLDEGLLAAANSPGPPEAPDVTTKQIFLAFDLSGVDYEINSAVLRLSALTCEGLVPADAVDVTVYGVNNDAAWAEDTLTWDNQPGSSTGALAGLDAGETIFDTAQTYTWTDDNQGDLATWLESQRGANDGSATLILVIENGDDPGMADIFFEDREGTGTAYGCADSLGSPALEVSDSIGRGWIYLPLVLR